MSREIKPAFAIMGSGGMGGYIGAKLHQAGYEVSFVARGAHLEAMTRAGLQIEGPGEEFVIHPIKVTAEPDEIGKVDYVIFAVKLWDTEAAAKQCRGLLGPKTAVLSMQNGVDSEKVISDVLGAKHVMGAVAEVGANIIQPGFVRRFTTKGALRFGEIDQSYSARSNQFREAIAAIGFEADLSQNINVTIWDKFLFLVATSALNCVTGMPIGVVRKDPDTRALLRQLMDEVVSVANAKGVPLSQINIEARLSRVDALPDEARMSMAVDLQRGNRLELPWLSGAVSRMGRELNIPTPANSFVYAALKHRTDGDG
jgi:2-dehydropantoate 2-reductase